MLFPPIPLHNPAVIAAPPRSTTPAAAAAAAAATPAPPSEALLAQTLAEAERLAKLAPEKGQARARLLAAAAGAYVAADRPDDAGRLYRAAVASAARDSSDRYIGDVFRDVARWLVAARDDATALKAANIAAKQGDSDIVKQVTFLIERRDAPAGSPLRGPNEKEAYQIWGWGKYMEAIRKDARTLIVATLDEPKVPVNRRLSALRQLLWLEPENRSATVERYLPAISQAALELTDPVQRAEALMALAWFRHETGDAGGAQSALAGAVEAAALIPDTEKRLRQARMLLSTGMPSPRALAAGKASASAPSASGPSVPDALDLPTPLRERVTAIAKSALGSLAEGLTHAKNGEAPDAAVQRLVQAAGYGQDMTGPLYTREHVLGLMKLALAEAKKLSPVQRQVSLRMIAMVQTRAADPDAVLATLRLSPDRDWRISTLLGLALDSGAPNQRTPPWKIAQQARLGDAALAEARSFPAGPARYRALADVLRWNLTWGKGTPAQNRALFQEMAALVPKTNKPFPPGWVSQGDAPAGFLLHLAHFGQHTGDHAAARVLLARASALTIQSLAGTSPSADSLSASIARAQAFSGDFAGAKATLRAASSYYARRHYYDEQTGRGNPGSSRAGAYAGHAVEQAEVRDFDGALQTVTKAIPARFVAERSGALSGIAGKMAAARKGKPIEPFPDYVW
jgi:hypothetical protein